jgi:hypothetical protein
MTSPVDEEEDPLENCMRLLLRLFTRGGMDADNAGEAALLVPSTNVG